MNPIMSIFIYSEIPISRGVDPSSALGIIIISIGILITIGLPVLMILKGRKE